MPYHWLPTDEAGATRLTLTPNRSLSRRGFAQVILLTFAMLSLPMAALAGTAAMWGLLPFGLGTVALLWFFLERNYADGALREELLLGPDHVSLTRFEPNGGRHEWQANPYWVTPELHASGGPVEHYVTLRGGGRQVEIGAFLSPDERQALYPEICQALQRARLPDVPDRSAG